MIGAMREKMQGVFATVIIVFICVIFALFGADAFFSGGGQVKAPVTVDGVEISEQQINQAITAARARYGEMFQGKIDPSFLTDQMLREPALESLMWSDSLNQASQRDENGSSAGCY
ncbi:MAG: SurA N-terminal domain-containing protein [Pseudomonadales bacterium]